MIKLKCFLYIDSKYVEIEQSLFNEILSLYSSKFGIIKFNSNDEPSCESDLFVNQPLFYYLCDLQNNSIVYFARVIKIA